MPTGLAQFNVMPRYFFFLESSEGVIEDYEGDDLPDDLAAHEAALVTARELGDWHRHSGGRVIVKDKNGRLVTEVPLKAVFN
jgi:hypothetical protein